VLLLLTVVANPKRLIVATVLMIGLVAGGGPLADAIEGTQQRFADNRYPEYTFFEERGYDRILAHKEYWLLGAGEGATDRFAATTRISTAEIHSSMGTLFFCYGIVGITLFLVFLYRVAKGAPLRSIVMLAPALAYTFAHQGLRSTSAWILFGVFVAIKVSQRTTTSKPAPATAASGAPGPLALALTSPPH
jgi:hypothetical protein